jgi:hypothetical protein
METVERTPGGGMRVTWALVVGTGLALAVGGTMVGPSDDEGAAARLVAAPGEGSDAGWPPGFDGRLWPDPGSGCFRSSPLPELPEAGSSRPEAQEVRPDPVEPDPEARPSPAPPPEESWPASPADTFRGPWPLCEGSSTTVHLERAAL